MLQYLRNSYSEGRKKQTRLKPFEVRLVLLRHSKLCSLLSVEELLRDIKAFGGKHGENLGKKEPRDHVSGTDGDYLPHGSVEANWTHGAHNGDPINKKMIRAGKMDPWAKWLLKKCGD